MGQALPLLIIILLVLPLAVGVGSFISLFYKKSVFAEYLMKSGAASIVLLSLVFAYLAHSQNTTYYSYNPHWLHLFLLSVETAITALVVFLGFRKKQWFAPLVAVAQFAVMAWFSIFVYSAEQSVNQFYFDPFSVIMVLLIGVIGSLICYYAIGYLKDYHKHHHDIKDRSGLFFFLLFGFLSAMFGVVFSAELSHLLFFWELTTLCSFLLIGYTQTKEAIRNAFRALNINLAGGLAFSIALPLLYSTYHTLNLHELMRVQQFAALPLLLLALAGLTKSAQLPFSSWLLGAMVAPTPTSALLHSSTMVKAGVFLLLKLAPAFHQSIVGSFVALIGGVTFVVCSMVNISEVNAKRLLAYSTIANLGLIVACAGVGSAEAVWIGIFLIIFHAAAKSLLFLLVGTLENRVHSKSIENFDFIMHRFPKIASMMTLGISCMFLAPFGVVISKWAAFEAFLSIPTMVGGCLIIMLAYGSGATVLYWGKLIGKIISFNNPNADAGKDEKLISKEEWVAEWGHVGLNILICLGFSLISAGWVEPYLLSVFGRTGSIGQGNLLITCFLAAITFAIPALVLFLQKKSGMHSDPYLSGRTLAADGSYEGGAGLRHELSFRNYYLESTFSERRLIPIGVFLCCFLLAAAALFVAIQSLI